MGSSTGKTIQATGLTALGLLLALGCAGTGPTTTTGSTPATSATTAPGVAEYLTLDLATFSNYAQPTFPAHYDAQVLVTDNQLPTNVVTDRGATLGRVLFHDRRLSVSDTLSCASCHQQSLGMGDSATFSAGFAPGLVTATHAMRLHNTRFYAPGTMFWDKRAPSLEFQTTQPIQSSVEMGFDAAHGGLPALFTKMQALPYYPELFKAVYGDAAITEDRIQKALAQYVRSMVSTHSRWDDGAALTYNPALPGKGAGAPKPNFTASENRGQQLFFTAKANGGAGCIACHTAPTFALAPNSLSNGLTAGDPDIYKSPSLKGVSATGPYMHTGSLATLEAVVDHYDHGIQDGPALDPRLRGPNGLPQRLNLSAADRAALVDFMKTLQDPALATDPRFSNPFKK
ncbi:MAG TPA: cytochrome c peroxidase [Holophagaceae bacterium]|nr:cytochrome c peroxidase [Holophagaceae bacterium]